MNKLSDIFSGMFLITIGGGGGFIALIRSWQEQLEWAARMTLVLVSIFSVSVGIYYTVRRGKKPPDDGDRAGGA